MAIFYVRSTDGNDADDGSTWALAKATINGALTAAAAGDTIYVSHNHAETQAGAMTIGGPGVVGNPVKIICVNDGAEPPTTLATTATVSKTNTTGGSFSFQNFGYVYGITFIGSYATGSNFLSWSSTNAWWWRFDNCEFRYNRAVDADILIGANNVGVGHQLLEWYNCTVRFNTAGQTIQQRAPLYWDDGAVVGTTLPTTLFGSITSNATWCKLVGIDLSALGSGKNLFSVGGGSPRIIVLEDCKLGASVSITTGTPAGHGGAVLYAYNIDSAGTNYRYQKTCYQGSIYDETVIVRTGGASTGATPISYKMVSSANALELSPLKFDELIFWNETVGSPITIKANIITDNVTLTDAEAWIEAHYLGDSGSPMISHISDRRATLLTTPANQATNTADWTTTGLTTPIKQELSVTFTPQLKGPVKARICLGKPSTTMYVCPELIDNAGRSYQVSPSSYLNEPAVGLPNRANIIQSIGTH